MKQQKYQSGFAHLMVITIILGLGLVGTLGFVFYQNVIQKKDNTTKPVVVADDKKDEENKNKDTAGYKSYTTDQYDISFQYPDTWSINETEHGGGGYYGRNVEIKNADGEAIANFAVGMQLGGYCDNPTNYTILESVETKFLGDVYDSNGSIRTQTAALSFTVLENEDGGYGAHYGLSDQYTVSGATGKACGNVFYYKINPKIDGIVGLSFGDSVTGGLKKFSSIDDARKYISSDEYKEIKKMILSLNY